MRGNFKIKVFSDNNMKLWDSFIDQSQNGTIFHKYSWLKSIEQESNTKLYPLVCEKPGEGIIGVFPVFLQKKMSLRIILSPPNGCAVPELGPVFFFKNQKPQKTEADMNAAITTFLHKIESDLKPDFYYFTTNLYDIRPFTWNGFTANPLYTYVLDLKKNKELFDENLDKRIRNRVKKIENDKSFTIKEGGSLEISEIITSLKEKYRLQNRTFKPSIEYFNNLLSLEEGKNLKCKIIYQNEKPLTGFILLNYKNSVRSWLGGVHSSDIPSGVIEYLQWKNITDSIESGYDTYERIGANTHHLSVTKAKYGLTPKIYFSLQKSNFKGRLFFSLYNFLFRKNN